MKIIGLNNDLAGLFPEYCVTGTPAGMIAAAAEGEALLFTAGAAKKAAYLRRVPGTGGLPDLFPAGKTFF